jgi:6-phosphofructokinase 2
MPSSRIVALTPNPAVDVCVSVERMVPFHKMRCADARRDAGGGGINVARVINRLGGHPLALFPAGGPIGRLLENLVAAEGVQYRSLPIAGDTREDMTIDERSTGAQFRFVLPGPSLSPIEAHAFLNMIETITPEAEYVVASGSLPPGLAAEFYALAARLLPETKFILDTSGLALAAALEHGVHMIKPSLRELRELTGETLSGERSWLEAAKTLVSRRSVEWVALTLGEDGALLVGRDQVLRATAPKITAASTVGAGDSFLGALVWAMASGRDMKAALRLAVASGSAAMLARGTELGHPSDIARLAEKVEVHEL